MAEREERPKLWVCPHCKCAEMTARLTERDGWIVFKCRGCDKSTLRGSRRFLGL